MPKHTGYHAPTMWRRQIGMTPIRPSRPLYGWTVECSCGWEAVTNENKRYVTKLFNWHVREAAKAAKDA